MLNQLSTIFLDLLFPRLCLSCKKNLRKEGALCPDCLRTIPIYKKVSQEKPFCIFALSSYQDKSLKDLILEFKFKRRKEILKDFEILIASYLQEIQFDQYDFILPVPVSDQTMRNRGFNQSEHIAEILRPTFADALYSKNLLLRTKHRPSQSKMDDFSQRWENIRNAFKVSEPKVLSGSRVLVVDDVYTSGATANEIRKVLKESGAKKIDLFVLAKTS